MPSSPTHPGEIKQRLQSCQQSIQSLVHRTPVLTSRSLNDEFGCRLHFKCENFQRTGSFKIRGATHAIQCLSLQQKKCGVVAHSSGNFAQAIALAAQQAGIPARIAMPTNAPASKLEATRAYGGQVVLCQPTAEDRERQAARLVSQHGAILIHPSNDLNVIYGQGTAAWELLEDVDQLDCLLVPIGGGGLIAGCCLAACSLAPQCRVIGAEPAAADDAFRSLRSGTIQYNQTTDTIADGLRTFLGDQNFPIIQHHVREIIRVSEHEIIEGLKLVWQRLKIVIEPSAAVPVAALMQQSAQFAGQNVGLLLSGGNIDLDRLPF